MENKNKRNNLLTGAILAGALATFTISNVDARPATTRVLGNGAELRSEIIDLNVVASPANVFEMKCGEKTKKTEKGKTVESKCGADKKAEKKVENGKTVESKCGANKKTKADKKTEKKANKKSKTTEGKCGQGKCGAA